MRRVAWLCLSLGFAFSPLQGAAKTPKATLAAPPLEGPTHVEFSTNPVSKWTDLPLGTYRVPNSDVIISGHQKSGAGMLFGVIGVAIQNSVQASNGKQAMASAEQALTPSIDEQARTLLATELADPAYVGKYTLAGGAVRRLEVTGAVVMSFAGQHGVTPFVVLRAKLLNPGGSKLWTTRYIAGGPRKPLVGEGSWTADDGGLRPQVDELLKVAIHTMLKDIADPYPRDPAQMLAVQGYFTHMNVPMQLVGYKLAEVDGRLLFLPNMGTTIVFAGVNILDAGTVTYRPMAKGDKVKALKPQEWTPPEDASADPEADADAGADVDAGARPADTDEQNTGTGA